MSDILRKAHREYFASLPRTQDEMQAVKDLIAAVHRDAESEAPDVPRAIGITMVIQLDDGGTTVLRRGIFLQASEIEVYHRLAYASQAALISNAHQQYFSPPAPRVVVPGGGRRS